MYIALRFFTNEERECNMKLFQKIMSIILFTSLFLFSALAEQTIDFSALSVEELLTLKSQVETALVEKGVGMIIPEGCYIVGIDIAAGTYVFSGYLNSEEWYANAGSYKIWKDESLMKQYKTETERISTEWMDWISNEKKGEEPVSNLNELDFLVSEEFFNKPHQLRVSLEEGQVIEISAGTTGFISIEKATGLFMD